MRVTSYPHPATEAAETLRAVGRRAWRAGAARGRAAQRVPLGGWRPLEAGNPYYRRSYPLITLSEIIFNQLDKFWVRL